jgi:hypothetical protein
MRPGQTQTGINLIPYVAIGALFLAVSVQAAEPVVDQTEPFLTVPGGFSVTSGTSSTTVTVTSEPGTVVAAYALPDCQFCAASEGNCTREGVFSLNFPGAVEPMVGASCHGVDGGQRFFLLAPARDSDTPIFGLRGDVFVEYAIYPDQIVLTRDRGGASGTEIWRPGAPQNADAVASALAMAALARGREVAAPAPVDDPGFIALADRLRAIAEARDSTALVAMAAPNIKTSFGGGDTIGELRELIAETWFWPEFARLLAGGGTLNPSWNGGRRATFPAAFNDWPDDLDAYEFMYGDLPGAVLRAGPSDTAPILMALHRRILAVGPWMEGENALRQPGWSYICVDPVGCGYARHTEVRSPIDQRAILTQTDPDAPWVLVTLVAGD